MTLPLSGTSLPAGLKLVGRRRGRDLLAAAAGIEAAGLAPA